MKLCRVFLFLLIAFVHLLADARPVRKSTLTLSQPDGSCFPAVFHGDEFIRIKTTLQGNAIVQDADGWWCYALYAGNGVKHSSGVRVGENCPSDILSASRNIPYRRLSEQASAKRMSVEVKQTWNLKQIPEKHGIVILAQFANLQFKHEKEDFESLLNQKGYSRNGATGCAKEYFDAQFGGAVKFSFDVSDIVTLSHDLAYYGANVSSSAGVESDKAPYEMIIEACELVDEEIDFAKYDDDGDGEVDNIFVFFAGGDEAEGAGDDCIWSHAWHLNEGAGKTLTLDGKLIDRYACASEMTRYISLEGKVEQRLAGIGTFCHEYAHTFGLPDMYDTDYDGSGGESDALWGSTSLMDGGNQNNGCNTPPYFNAIEREILGISEPVLIENDGSYTMEPVHKGGTVYRMNTDVEGEYYLFECRAQDSWDRYIGGSGMLVYHVDKSDRPSGYSDTYAMELKAMNRWKKFNEVNCRPDHQCADLVEAMDEATGAGGVFYPLKGVNEIPADKLKWWSGESGKFSITGIQMQDQNVRFNVVGGADDTTPPEPVRLGFEKFQDAAVITFESDRVYEGKASVLFGKSGSENQSFVLSPYEPGKYALLIEGLQPRTSYSAIVKFVINGVEGKDGVISFLTNSYTKGYPYIYLKNVKRNPDGTFPAGSRLPLRVYNAPEAAEVVWTMDGKVIAPDASGYYTLKSGGLLKAVVFWKDGSQDVIIKEITVTE